MHFFKQSILNTSTRTERTLSRLSKPNPITENTISYSNKREAFTLYMLSIGNLVTKKPLTNLAQHH